MTIPDLSRAKSGADWRDGLFAGNGSHGVLAYAPAHLEWVVNKNDLFDGRVPPSKFLTHAEVMRRVAERTPKNSRFLNEVETHDAMSSDRTISAAILRVRFWRGFGWNTPAAPQVSERLSPGEGEIVQCVEAPFLHVSALTVVPHGPDIVAIRIACEPGCRPPLVIDLVRPEDERLADAPAWCGDDGVLSFSQRRRVGRRRKRRRQGPSRTRPPPRSYPARGRRRPLRRRAHLARLRRFRARRPRGGRRGGGPLVRRPSRRQSRLVAHLLVQGRCALRLRTRHGRPLAPGALRNRRVIRPGPDARAEWSLLRPSRRRRFRRRFAGLHPRPERPDSAAAIRSPRAGRVRRHARRHLS